MTSNPDKKRPTRFVIEGCHETHRWAVVGLFSDRRPRVCMNCFVQETSPLAEEKCDRAEKDGSE